MTEESTQKKSAGYTYWKRDIPDAHLLPSSTPQPLAHSASEESIGNTRTSSAGLVSAWNQGTTYEERDVTARAKSLLSQLVEEIGETGSLFQFDSMDGEIHAIHVRGKVRIGYEIHKLKLKVDEESIIEIDDLDSTDREGFRVRQDGGLERVKVKELIVKLMDDLCTKLLSDNQ